MKESDMKAGWVLTVSVSSRACGCAMKESKVAVDQTPQPLRATILRELAGAELEDIAKKERNGRTVYEMDFIRDGHKWEAVIREDGTVLSKTQEEAVESGTGKRS